MVFNIFCVSGCAILLGLPLRGASARLAPAAALACQFRVVCGNTLCARAANLMLAPRLIYRRASARSFRLRSVCLTPRHEQRRARAAGTCQTCCICPSASAGSRTVFLMYLTAMGLQKCQYARHSGEGNEVSSFAPQTANSSPGATQAYLQSNRADGSQAVFGKPSQVLSGRGRCCVGVHHFGLDLVSMLSSAISQLQHPAGSCMAKAAAAAVLTLEALMPQRAAANQHAGIPGVYLRQATPLSRPACAVRVALQSFCGYDLSCYWRLLVDCYQETTTPGVFLSN